MIAWAVLVGGCGEEYFHVYLELGGLNAEIVDGVVKADAFY